MAIMRHYTGAHASVTKTSPMIPQKLMLFYGHRIIFIGKTTTCSPKSKRPPHSPLNRHFITRCFSPCERKNSKRYLLQQRLLTNKRCWSRQQLVNNMCVYAQHTPKEIPKEKLPIMFALLTNDQHSVPLNTNVKGFDTSKDVILSFRVFLTTFVTWLIIITTRRRRKRRKRKRRAKLNKNGDGFKNPGKIQGRPKKTATHP